MATFALLGAKEAAQRARRARFDLDLGKDAVLRDLADLWREGEGQIFRTYGGAIHKPWKPLADSTAKRRARLSARFGLPIRPRDPRLVLFGDLRAALTEKGGAQNQSPRGGTLTISVQDDRINRHNRSTGARSGLTKKGLHRKVRGRGGRYPENIIEIHDEGTARIPARPVIGIPDGIERKMESRVKRYLRGVLATLAGSAIDGAD
jgi:hypothetical protein